MNYGIRDYLYGLTHGEDEDCCPDCGCFDCECECEDAEDEEGLAPTVGDPLRGWAA